jgi:uncharacterized protein YbjT (DUF2867 family)
MTLLIVGATGKLGRQITKQAIAEGYQVKCLVRDFYRAAFLKTLGAELVYGDLTIPETLPNALKGVSIVIDSSVIRLSDSVTLEIIYRGKVALIEASKVAKIQKFIFFSLLKDFFSPAQNEEVNKRINQIVEIENNIATLLKNSSFEHKIFMCSGFLQSLISELVIPILETKKIDLLRTGVSPISYVSTQDVAKVVVMTLVDSYMFQNTKYQIMGLGLEWTDTKILTDQRFWTLGEIVSLSDRLSGQTTEFSYASEFNLLNFTKFVSLFKFAYMVRRVLECSSLGPFFQLSERTRTICLAFSSNSWEHLFKPLPLEKYLQDFYSTLVKKVKKVGYQRSK